MCGLELSDLESSVWAPYREAGVQVYGIYSSESEADLADFAQQTGVTFPLVQDQGTISSLAYPPGTSYPYPRDVVVGRDLRVRSIRNSFNIDELTAEIEALLAEEP